MTIAIGVLLVAIAGAFVAWPFLQHEEPNAGIPPGETPQEFARRQLEHTKFEAYGAIRDAEVDYHTGKLSDADFDALRTKYENQALQSIGALEKMRGSPTERRKDKKFKFCPACGSTVPPQAKYCPGCGGNLKPASLAA